MWAAAPPRFVPPSCAVVAARLEAPKHFLRPMPWLVGYPPQEEVKAVAVYPPGEPSSRAAHTEERSAHRRRGFTRHSLHSDRPARSPRRSGRQPFLQPCRAAVRRSRPRRRCGRCHGAGTTANRDVGASTHAYHDPEQVRSRAAWARLAGILRRSGVMNPLPPNYKNSLVQEPRLSEEVAAAGIARLP